MKPIGHRNLFNADGNVWVYKYRPQSYFYRPDGQPLTAQDIHHYIDVIADAGVDTFIIQSADVKAYYPSKTMPTYLDGYTRGDKSFFFGTLLGSAMTPDQIEDWLAETMHIQDSYLDLVDAGVDWLAETAAACRNRGVSPWISVRMNDMHGGGNPYSYMNSSLHRDPAMRLRGTSYNPEAPTSPGWRGLNYEHQEVRDYTMGFIRDAVENYDYEAILIDWMRWPLCCEPDASQETIDMMTAWHAEIRQMTERQAAKTGRPFNLGIKAPGNLDQLRSIGLDFRAMARQGLLDFFSPSNSWQSSWDIPLDTLREELGPDVAIHGVVEIAPNWLNGWLKNQPKGNAGVASDLAINYRLTAASAPILYGNAAAKLVLGADAVETYNFPPTDQFHHWPWVNDEDECHADYPILRNIEDLEFLRGKPKLYTLATRNGYYMHELFDIAGPFATIIGPCQRQECRVPMCAEPEDEKLEFIIQVVVDKKDNLPPIGVYINGHWPNFKATPDERLLFPVSTMTHHTPDHIGLNFTFPLSAIREGWNDIGVMNGKPYQWWEDQSCDAVNVVCLECGIREKK